MMEDELIKIWKSSPQDEQIKFEKSRLILDMQNSLDRFHRLVKIGIIIGQVAVLTIIPVFLFYIYFVPPILAKIASFFIVIWACWYMFLLRKIQKSKPNVINLNYLDYLNKNRTYMSTIKKLGATTLYWYILPPMAGYFLFITGFYFDGIVDDSFFIKLILIGVGTVILTYMYSRWVVKKIYSPRLQKIDELIKVMEE